MNNKIVYHCPVCHKEMPLGLANIVKYPRTIFYIKDTYEMKSRIVCSDECLKAYESRLICDTYKGHNIYKIGDRYMPYLGCEYYFDSIDGVKNRIDHPHLIPLTPSVLDGLVAVAKGEL